MTAIILQAVASVLVLVGIWNEEKLIEFEDRLLDRAAYRCACVIVKHKNEKAGREVWSVRR